MTGDVDGTSYIYAAGNGGNGVAPEPPQVIDGLSAQTSITWEKIPGG